MDTDTLADLRATHQLYCQLTGQKLSLRFDRERLWYEFLRAGFSAQDLKRVVAYLQKEIRASRRNVGALKLSNLLQLDRFEEDLNISNVRLRSAPPPQSSRSTPTDPPPPTPAELHDLRQMPASATACASWRFVVEASKMIPASRSARTRSGAGTPKWKLTTLGFS